MNPINKIFTATGASKPILALNGQGITYMVGGVFVGEWQITQSNDNGSTWNNVLATGDSVMFGPEEVIIDTLGDPYALVRIECSSYTSGDMWTTIIFSEDGIGSAFGVKFGADSWLINCQGNPGQQSMNGLRMFFSGEPGEAEKDSAVGYDRPATLTAGNEDKHDTPSSPTPVPYGSNWFLSNLSLGQTDDAFIRYGVDAFGATDHFAFGVIANVTASNVAGIYPFQFQVETSPNPPLFGVKVGSTSGNFAFSVFYNENEYEFVASGGLNVFNWIKVGYRDNELTVLLNGNLIQPVTGSNPITGLDDLPLATDDPSYFLGVKAASVVDPATAFLDGPCLADFIDQLPSAGFTPDPPEAIGTGYAGTGSIATDSTTGKAYTNTGTKEAPVWVELATVVP